jgi:hypothetical protein
LGQGEPCAGIVTVGGDGPFGVLQRVGCSPEVDGDPRQELEGFDTVRQCLQGSQGRALSFRWAIAVKESGRALRVQSIEHPRLDLRAFKRSLKLAKVFERRVHLAPLDEQSGDVQMLVPLPVDANGPNLDSGALQQLDEIPPVATGLPGRDFRAVFGEQPKSLGGSSGVFQDALELLDRKLRSGVVGPIYVALHDAQAREKRALLAKSGLQFDGRGAEVIGSART